MDFVKKTIKTYEDVALSYAEKQSDINVSKSMLDSFITKLNGNIILDAGCGPGRDAKYLVDKELKVIGIDLSQKFIDIAKKKVPNAEFLRMDMRKLSFQDNYFDGIWSRASLLHIPKNEAKNNILEFKRVLKKNGILYISVKSGIGEKFIKEEQYKNKERFFAFYSNEELKNLVESCGFKNIEIINETINNILWINLFCIK